MASCIPFTAHVVPGAGRGRTLGVPTMNLDLKDVPQELEEGIYACLVTFHVPHSTFQNALPAVLHYGPRPVFKEGRSCEVHLIDNDQLPMTNDQSLNVEVVERIRGVRDFEDVEALKEEMQRDIASARVILRVRPKLRRSEGGSLSKDNGEG